MDVYIIDTNIVFSAAMNPNSDIGKFIMGTKADEIKFYAPAYLRAELSRHFAKLVDKSQLTEDEVREQIELVYRKIHFISDDQIPIAYYSRAAQFVRDLDVDDTIFVALNEYLNETLWTGDLKLYRHLVKKGYERVVIFAELKEKYQ